MSLTGHLDVFPLEEILRLLARTHKTGCLQVESPGLQGRVFLNDGSLAFATVGSDEDLSSRLLGSNLATEEAFLKEEVVENLYRIRRPGRGHFVFTLDVTARVGGDAAFDVEWCIAEADRRAAEWADVESVIPSIDLTLSMNPEAPEGQPVTLSPGAWRVIAGFRGSDTIRGLSDRLGISRFSVARDLSALVRGNLVTIAVESTIPTEAADERPIDDGPAFPPPSLGTVPEPISARALRTTTPTPPESYNQGWWTEPVAEPLPGKPATGPAEAEDSDEHFLEQVFSQLEENPEGAGAAVDANGEALRRRRMTSVAAEE